MNCRDVRARLQDARMRHDASIEAHLRNCVECALLAADADLTGLAGSARVTPADIEALLGDTQSRLRRERGPAAWLRSRRTRTRLLLGAAAALGVPLLFALAAPRPDLTVYPMVRLLTIATLLVLLSGVALSLKLRPLHRPALPTGMVTAVLIGAVLVVAIDIALPPAHALSPASLQGTGADFARRAAGCFFAGLLIGLPALLAAGLLDRGEHPHSAASDLLTPLLAAVAGYLALDLHCPLVGRAHLLAGHASLLLALPLLFIVWRSIQVRRTRG
jgi:hypothetical protein